MALTTFADPVLALGVNLCRAAIFVCSLFERCARTDRIEIINLCDASTCFSGYMEWNLEHGLTVSQMAQGVCVEDHWFMGVYPVRLSTEEHRPRWVVVQETVPFDHLLWYSFETPANIQVTLTY